MRATLAGFLDDRLLEGPVHKKHLAKEGEQVRLTLGHSTKCTPGTVRAHARYRADTGPYKFWEDGDLLMLIRCDDPVASLKEEGMSDIKPEKCGLEEVMNESQESGQSFWPVLKALAIGVIVFMGVVFYALIAACVGAHKREGR